MNTCKDCRFWKPYHPDLCKGDSIGTCDYSDIADEIMPVIHIADEPFPEESRYNGIDTMPDFGCIHHEPKDKDEN